MPKKKRLKRMRVAVAAIIFTLLTLLFLDFTGTIHLWFGWLAKIQLIPAILAANIIVITVLVIITLLFGRIYCSALCPLGMFQDGISNISGRRKGKKNRFRYSQAQSWLRYGVLGLFIIAIVAGISAVASLLDPYAAYGRMASNVFAPLYRLGNNFLASIAERMDSYAFYATEVWIKGWVTFGIAAITFLAIGILAWRNGRTYCNTICPAGTFLGFLSKYALFRLSFDEEKCNKCKTCERGCKASCIDMQTMGIDHSRCVACFNCMDKCTFGAIEYTPVKRSVKKTTSKPVTIDNNSSTENSMEGFSRRSTLLILGAITVAGTVKAQQLQVDGGLADIEDKKRPDRKTPVAPPGASGAQHMRKRCTACQLCVSACPNNVLRPSFKLATLMQPEMSFERGYCRPECVECSQVCPTNAIKPITAADKSATSIGHAVWITDNCVVNTEKLPCTACERHCPTKAITLVSVNPEDENRPQQGFGFPGRRPPVLKIPTINQELCIGCGACEYYCPARPFSAIFVEGNVRHHSI